MNELQVWFDFFEQNNISPNQRNLFLSYIERLLKNNVPIIFEFNHLARLLGFDLKALAHITISTEKSYRTFSIPKRRGGTRIIASPYPALAHCQRWLYENLLKNIDQGEHSYAYCSGKSIINNATLHLNSEEMLKVDIINFFGSIELNRVITIFKNLGYTNSLSFHLASICCYKGALPQGACTSPIISNIIAKRLDRRLAGLCKNLDLTYSRYADDITISGNHIPKSLINFIEKIMEDEGFSINKEKTVFKVKGQKKIVTGLNVSGAEVRVSKKYRREFRKDAYFLLKNGISEFNGKQDRFDLLYVDRLIGKANFILSVEPLNKFVKNNLPKLKDLKATLNIRQPTNISQS
jgi:RNA-directed DNA polymerase